MKPTLKIFIFNLVACLSGVVLLAGCRRDQFTQPKSNPLRESDFFADGADSRPLPPHSIAHAETSPDQTFDTGLMGTNPVTEFPFPITRAVLERGRERFEIACVPCHGRTGEGNGVVVGRGFPAPPAYTLERLREAPVGHFVNVMARGYGVMYPQSERVTPEDRWAIAAYIRALQLSQHAPLAAVPAEEQSQLTSTP
jgi:mono/diheme cytochrome c family protein